MATSTSPPDFWDSVWSGTKELLTTVAPAIATAFGGPLAGTAVRIVAQTLVGDADAPAEQVVAALQGATPEQLKALKDADNAFKEKMAGYGIELARLAEVDTDSARKRQIELKDNTPAVLAYILTLGFFGLLALMAFVGFPPANEAVLNTMTGSLGTVWLVAMHFFYGSNMTSRETNSLLYNSTPVTR